MARPAIIISGMPGVGKSTLAKLLAKELGVEYICGGDLLKEIARKRGYEPTENWWETKEGMEFLIKRRSDPSFDRELDKLLVRRATKGDCVITSWTLPWIWKGGIKIWLSASQLERARRIARRSNLSMKEALRLIKQRDDENVKLYKRLYGYELEKDLEAFDLIVDNEGVTPAEILRNLLRVLKDEFGIVKL